MTDTDIVTRLRDYYTSDADSFRIEHPICQEAADEIERLRKRLDEYEPEPIVVNQKAPGDLNIGDYVFASRWSDCDPGDPWAVGRVTEIGRHHDDDATVYPGWVMVEGSNRHWVHAMKITPEQGRSICDVYPGAEDSGLDYQARARVFGKA